jgi:hypothetical protein
LVRVRVVSGTGGSVAYAEQAAVDAVGWALGPERPRVAAAVVFLVNGRTAALLIQTVGLDAQENRAGRRRGWQRRPRRGQACRSRFGRYAAETHTAVTLRPRLSARPF